MAVVGNHNDVATDDGAHGMRWSVLNTRNTDEVRGAHVAVKAMITAFPDLAAGEYKTWEAVLENVLLPGATS